MRLTVIGCAGSYPGPDSSNSCYLVEHEHEGRTWRLLLDLGSGALGRLQQTTDPLAIDAVFLSHLHADHCLDLCGYYVLRKYHPTGPQPRLAVHGPEGTADRMARAYDLELDPGMHEEFDFRTYAEPVRVGPFTVEAIEVNHPVTAFALRVSAGGRVLAYSGDTGTCPQLDDVARDADLWLVEASFEEGRPNPPDLHLTGREGAEVAVRAGARRVVLTHVPPWHDPAVVMAEAAAVWDGPLDRATPGAVFEI